MNQSNTIVSTFFIIISFQLVAMEKEKNSFKTQLLAQAAKVSQGLDTNATSLTSYTLKMYNKHGLELSNRKIRTVLAKYSSILNTQVTEKNEEKELILPQESVKSISADEIIRYLYIIHQGYTTHRDYEKLHFDLQTEILLNATLLNPKKKFQKLTDICHAANYLDIPELLKASTEVLALELAQNPQRKRVATCSKLGADVENQLAISTNHPVFPWLQGIINKKVHIRRTEHGSDLLQNICFNPQNSDQVAGFSKNMATVTNYKTGKAAFEYIHTADICDIQFNPTLKLLAICASDGTHTLANPETKISYTINYSLKTKSKIIWSHIIPNRYALITDNRLIVAEFNNQVRAFEAKYPNFIGEFQFPYLLTYKDIVTKFEWHPTNPNIFAICTNTGRLGIIRIPDKAHDSVESLTDFYMWTCMKWHPNSPDMLLAATNSGDLFLIDISKNEPLLQLRGHSKKVNALQFNPRNPNLVLSCSDDKKVIRWNLRKRKNCFVYPEHITYHDTPVLDVQWHPLYTNIYGSEQNSLYRFLSTHENFVLNCKILDGKKKFALFHPRENVVILSQENEIITLKFHHYYALLKDLYSLTMPQTIHLIGLYNKYVLQKQNPVSQTIHELFMLPDSIARGFLYYFNLNEEQITLIFQILDKARQNTTINLTAEQEIILNQLPIFIRGYVQELIAAAHATTGNCS